MTTFIVSMDGSAPHLVSCATGGSVDFPDFIEKPTFFNKDKVEIGDCQLTLVSSPVREAAELSGVLKLDDRCRYGKDSGRFLYKCIPDDPSLPPFLVARKESRTEFSNKPANLFVLFRFSGWNDANTFPRAELVRTIGPVSDHTAYYEYQIVRHGLHTSTSKFGKSAISSARAYPGPVIGADRTLRRVVTIDPDGCRDFDDAVGVERTGGGYLLSVYIANVPRLIEALGLWSSVTERLSTIYMPDRKWHMLPPLISEGLASLVKGERRSAFAMDVELTADRAIKSVQFAETIICVSENHVYESDDLLADSSYKLLCEVMGGLAVDERCGPPLVGAFDSHDVIARLMVLMNHQASLVLSKEGKGIFRSVSKCSVSGRPDNVPDDVMNKIAIWRGLSGSYVDSGADLGHVALGLDSYVHITSPIRRLVDVINMVELSRCTGTGLEYPCSQPIIDKWLRSLGVLNARMKAVQRVQSDAAAVGYCLSNGQRECSVEGYAFDCKKRDDGFFRYRVYVPVLKTVLRVVVGHPLDELTGLTLSVIVFDDETTLSRRLRVGVASCPS